MASEHKIKIMLLSYLSLFILLHKLGTQSQSLQYYRWHMSQGIKWTWCNVILWTSFNQIHQTSLALLCFPCFYGYSILACFCTAMTFWLDTNIYLKLKSKIQVFQNNLPKWQTQCTFQVYRIYLFPRSHGQVLAWKQSFNILIQMEEV